MSARLSFGKTQSTHESIKQINSFGVFTKDAQSALIASLALRSDPQRKDELFARLFQ
jgi:hypothetical protein